MEQSSLKGFGEKKFSDYQFILVSNRAPSMHIYRGGEVEVIMPASVMAIALDSLMQTTGGTNEALWPFGHVCSARPQFSPAPIDTKLRPLRKSLVG